MKRKIIPLLLVCALLAGALLWLFVFPADVTRTVLRLLPAEQESAAAAAYYLDRIKSGETDDAHFLYVNNALSWESLRPGDLTVATVSLTAKNHLPIPVTLSGLSVPENALIAFIPASEKAHAASAFSEKTVGYTLYLLQPGDGETLSGAVGALPIAARFRVGSLLTVQAPVRLSDDKNE